MSDYAIYVLLYADLALYGLVAVIWAVYGLLKLWHRMWSVD